MYLDYSRSFIEHTIYMDDIYKALKNSIQIRNKKQDLNLMT